METKHDLFTKVGDKKDIVEFVKEVQRYPCLYNKNSSEYASKVHNRRAWSEIAKRANTTVPDCRDKWRKIRISFMRSLKQQQSNKPPMRPYYLTDELHFLVPFLKIRPKPHCESIGVQSKIPYESKVIQPKTDPMDFELATLQKNNVSISDNPSSDDYVTNENAKEISRITFLDNTITNIMKRRLENKQNVGRNGNTDEIEGNPRKMFLLSLLPDIESLTEIEMRIFRREVIKIMDNIITNRNSQ